MSKKIASQITSRIYQILYSFSNIFIFIASLFLVCILIAAYLPFPVSIYRGVSNPAQTYQEALVKLKNLQSLDSSEINPSCHTKALLHDEKVAKVIILYHGFTNCPAQFDVLSQDLYSKGYNVLIPRTRYHGYNDRLTEDPGKLTDIDLIDQVQQSVDIATGLGNSIVSFGLSGGGIMAAFGGYFRTEVDTIFLASPLFLPKQIDIRFANGFFNTIDAIPNYFLWWDDVQKEKVAGPNYAYPRFSSKGLLAYERVAYSIINGQPADLQKSVQSDKQIILLTTQNDNAINNEFVTDSVNLMTKNLGATLTSYRFPKSKNVIHDFIDPNQTEAKTEIAYPKILDLLERAHT
jgi:hypothetical protein